MSAPLYNSEEKASGKNYIDAPEPGEEEGPYIEKTRTVWRRVKQRGPTARPNTRRHAKERRRVRQRVEVYGFDNERPRRGLRGASRGVQ